MTEALEGLLKPGCAVAQKPGVVDIVFLAEFAQETVSRCGRSRGEQPDIKDVVGLRIVDSVQPVPLAVDSNHCFAERNLNGALLLPGCKLALRIQS